MKKLFVILLLVSSSRIIAQHNTEPEYYLNTERIYPEKIYINEKSIDSIHVGHETKNGEIHLFTKKTEFTYLTLAEIIEIHFPEMEFDDSIIFRINEKLIEDRTDLRIDDSFFIYTKIEDFSNIKYLNQKFKEFKIIQIDLETEKRKEIIFIRGNGEIQNLIDKTD